MSLCGITRPQWVKILIFRGAIASGDPGACLQDETSEETQRYSHYRDTREWQWGLAISVMNFFGDKICISIFLAATKQL